MRKIALIILAGSTLLAHAPLHYDTMKPRENAMNVKTSDLDALPCGPGVNATPGPPQHTLVSGQDFEVRWVETIDHPAKYIVELSPDNTDNFSITLMDLNDFYNDNLKPQDIPPAERQDRDVITKRDINDNEALYTYKVKIPNITCDQCAIRLVQKMFDGAGDSLRSTVYTHCTDVKIVADDSPNNPASEDAPSQPTGLKVEFKN